MPSLQFILDAFRATPPAEIAKWALIGAIGGAFVMPAICFIGLKLNLKGLRTVNQAARIPESSALYRLYAKLGAAFGAIMTGLMPVLDAAGKDEVLIRGALIPAVMVAVFWPFTRALKRLRESSSKPNRKPAVSPRR